MPDQGSPKDTSADGTTGQVILVGGGPGADDLITVRGLDRLMAADVVITDRLAPVTLLCRLGPEVEIIDAVRLVPRPDRRAAPLAAGVTWGIDCESRAGVRCGPG